MIRAASGWCRKVGWCAALLCAAACPRSEAQADANNLPTPGMVTRSTSGRCLSPDVGRILQELVAAGALRSALGDFTFESGNIGIDRIELAIRDANPGTYAIVLELKDRRAERPDGQGQRFSFFLVPPPGPSHASASRALLAAATLFDQAIPETALVRCAGETDPNAAAAGDHRGTRPPMERRFPRWILLASAVFQVAVVAMAMAFGIRTLRLASSSDTH